MSHLITLDPKCAGSGDETATSVYFQEGKGQHSEHVYVIYFGLSSPTWVHPNNRTMKAEETGGCMHHN